MRKGAVVLGAILVAGGLFLMYNDSGAGAWSTTQPDLAMTSHGDSYSGQIISLATPVVGVNVPDVGPLQTSQNLVQLDVDSGTQALALDLSADITTGHGELDMLVAPPGCELNTGCEIEVTTSGGQATWETPDPAEGAWTIRFFFDAPGGGIAGWTLEVTETVPAG